MVSGPPGVGKSAVARHVARRLGVQACDLDQMIERSTQRSPAEIIRTEGEQRFREIEAAVLESSGAEPAVLALGGGTLTTPRGRSAARARGPTVGLEADVETIQDRLKGDPTDRPLLAGGAEGLSTLLAKRAGTYAAVDRVLPASGEPEAVAEKIAGWAMDVHVVPVDVAGAISRVIVGRGLADAVRGAVAALQPGRPVLILADEGVPESRREGIVRGIAQLHRTHAITLPGGEAVKRWELLGEVLEGAARAGCGRQSAVVGIGGGATCDLAALAASLLGRGAPVVLVPTTIVAQVDAAIGGKCAVNLACGRNLAGTFHPATDVIADVELLDSLDPAEYRAGLAEVLKIAIISDPSLFDEIVAAPRLSAAQIARAVGHKADIVQGDPHERGRRRVLNLGHTLGHALETASDYGLKHGEAVAIGTASVARLSSARGWLESAERDRIIGGLEKVGLPTSAGPGLLDRARTYLDQDKKGDARAVDLIAIRGLGNVTIERLEWQDLAPELVRCGGTK